MPVRPARPEDVAPLAAALTRAFFDDPITCWVYANARTRARWSERFFHWELTRLLSQDVTWTTEGREGGAIWALPGRWREEPAEAVSLVRRTLPAVLLRLPRLLRGLAQVEARHPAKLHLYLAVLGVDPARQGEGLGSALIRPGLELCDREGLPAYLETGKERNVAFYGRHGFAVRDVLDLPKGPRVWTLWRDPTAAAG